MKVSGERHVVYNLSQQQVVYEGSYADCKRFAEAEPFHSIEPMPAFTIFAPVDLVLVGLEKTVEFRKVGK